MLANDPARSLESPRASPLHLAPKKDNIWRPCGNYWLLNFRIILDKKPIRHIYDFAHNLSGCKIFSTIDLAKAHNQIPVAKEDIPKTAITTSFGLYEFPFMTFGLRNASQTFQTFTDEMTHGLNFCYPCWITSWTSPGATRFMRTLSFIGYTICHSGAKSLESKVNAIKDFPLPKADKQLRRFLGMINFNGLFFPNFAQIQTPIYSLLARLVKGSHPIDMGEFR